MTKQFTYDLAVAYRVYPKMSSSPPPIFADDKFKLVEFCLQSFKASLSGLRVKLWALLNDCPPEYEELFSRRWPAEDLVLMRYPGVPPGTTLHEQARILMEQTDAEIVYFVEDDYFHLPGRFERAIRFLKQYPDADFATTYDHPDVYTTDLHRHRREVREFEGIHWKSCLGSTHTFLAKREALLEIRELFLRLHRHFGAKTIPDLAMWMALTKIRIFNPFKFMQWSLPHPYWAFSMVLSWRYCWREILGSRRYTMWIPNPSLATHMSAGLEAPGIDWQEEFRRQSSATETG
ncbi:MAG: glycosyltransferase family 2 protein [Verrucomicrobia bacterium]|nr:glycosyltransferase family 2 protein [Verrucomicrobiota bacterium]MDE3099507.1 glycosyltransferase family 2 protein [Verrucomicrobiota bacterium]